MADPTPPAAPRPCDELCACCDQPKSMHGEHDAEAAPPRATTPRDPRKAHLIVCAECTAGDYCAEGKSLGVPALPWMTDLPGEQRAPLAAHPATTPEPMADTIQSHDVRPFVRALARSAEILGSQEGLDTYLLASAHLLNWYAEQARALAGPPSRESGALPASVAMLREFVEGVCGHNAGREVRKDAPLHRALCTVESHLSTLERDAARMDFLERRYVVSVCFFDGSELNPASQSLRAAIDTARAALTPSGEDK